MKRSPIRGRVVLDSAALHPGCYVICQYSDKTSLGEITYALQYFLIGFISFKHNSFYTPQFGCWGIDDDEVMSEKLIGVVQKECAGYPKALARVINYLCEEWSSLTKRIKTFGKIYFEAMR